MDSIKLNLVNQSNDRNNSQVVIFQKNVAPNADETAVAWLVINNLGTGNYHPFVYPLGMEISASDSYGNFTPHLPADPGQQFQMIRDSSGDVLQYKGDATSSEEVQVLNSLNQGAINASVFKDGKLLAVKTSIAPEQMASFKFKPSLYIGVVSQVQQGKVMDSAIVSSINTELSLLGVASASIIMTGGGPGRTSEPFRFRLTDVRFT